MPCRRSGLLVPCFLAAALLAAMPSHAQSSFTSSTAATAGKVWSGAQDVAMYALGLIGVTYKFGGNSPDTGLDCSGLVRHVFEEVTGVSLPRTAKEMSTLGAKVSPANLQPGDLVFFNTRRFAFSHVGIYLGDNRFVHAPSRGSEVRIASIDQSYWQKHFNGARRVIGVLPSLVPSPVAPAVASELVAESLTVAPAPSVYERADLTP
jgi:cell wall-associated NlpC family hydrolase